MVASQLFTPEDKAAIGAAVAEAEKKTSGEIVPIVATQSDRYDRAEDIFGLLLAGLAFAVVWLTLQDVRPAEGDWKMGHETVLGPAILLVVFFGTWVIGVLVADKVGAIRRVVAGSWVMRPRVRAAAAEAFNRLHVRHTKGGSGIVLYVSLFEHMVCVEADRAIAQKVEPKEWKSICDGLVKAMKEKRHREGFIEAIGKCGALLAQHLPIQPDDVNELTNELRVID